MIFRTAGSRIFTIHSGGSSSGGFGATSGLKSSVCSFMGKNAACRVPRFRRLELTVGSALECSRSGALALHDARFVALLQRDLCFSGRWRQPFNERRFQCHRLPAFQLGPAAACLGYCPNAALAVNAGSGGFLIRHLPVFPVMPGESGMLSRKFPVRRDWYLRLLNCWPFLLVSALLVGFLLVLAALECFGTSGRSCAPSPSGSERVLPCARRRASRSSRASGCSGSPGCSRSCSYFHFTRRAAIFLNFSTGLWIFCARRAFPHSPAGCCRPHRTLLRDCAGFLF